MTAIHTFLSNPEAIRKLEKRYTTQLNPHPAIPFQPGTDELPIELTDGLVQLGWVQGRWTVRDWKTLETSPLGRAWIQPEENLISASLSTRRCCTDIPCGGQLGDG